MDKQEFIKQIAAYVKKYAPSYNIKVYSPIIAQAILESAYGTSELAVNAHNYFGLKYRAGRCKTCIGIYNKVGSEQNADGSYTSSSMQWCKFKDMENGVNIKIACHTTGLSDSSIIACQSLDELPREIINTLLLQPTFKEVLYRIFVVAGEKSVCQHLEQEVERTKTSSLTTPAELTLKKCAIPTLEQEEYQLNKYLHTLIAETVESLCSKNKAVSEYGKNGSGNLLRNSGFNGGQEK